MLADKTFLTKLVNDEYERRNQKLCQQLYNFDCISQSSSKSSISDITNLPLLSESQESDSEAKDGESLKYSVFNCSCNLISYVSIKIYIFLEYNH